MKNLILIGGGGHCKSVIDVIEQENKFKIVGIIDQSKLLGSKILGYPIIGRDRDLIKLAKKFQYAFVTVGQMETHLTRKKLFNLAKNYGFKLPTIVSPLAYVSKHSKVGSGSIIMHHAIINANSSIDQNCIINSKALIEHDCSVSKHCHISTNAVINGNVKIESGCFIGSNSTIKQTKIIKKNSFVKAHSFIK